MQEGLELFRDAGVVTPELNQQPHAIVTRHQLFWVPESSIISSTSLISSYRQNCHRPVRTSERGPQPRRRPRATGFPVCSVFAELIWLSAIAARCGRFQPIVPGLLGCPRLTAAGRTAPISAPRRRGVKPNVNAKAQLEAHNIPRRANATRLRHQRPPGSRSLRASLFTDAFAQTFTSGHRKAARVMRHMQRKRRCQRDRLGRCEPSGAPHRAESTGELPPVA